MGTSDSFVTVPFCFWSFLYHSKFKGIGVSWCWQNFHTDCFFFAMFLGCNFSKCIRNHFHRIEAVSVLPSKVSISMLSFRTKRVVFYAIDLVFKLNLPVLKSLQLRSHYSTTQIIVLLLIGVWFLFSCCFYWILMSYLSKVLGSLSWKSGFFIGLNSGSIL
jgi:hypothetical protein